VDRLTHVRILISGAGGFVGGHLALAMARGGHDVVALVRRVLRADLDGPMDVQIEQADLAVETEALPAGPFDAVIHCAAAIPSTVPDEAELTRINVEGSCRLFKHAVKSGAGIIVFCSSMAVYGRVVADVVDPDTPIDRPGTYGRSKLESERMLAELSHAHFGLRALSIRLPGVVGPGSHHNFLSDAMERLAAGERISVRNPEAPFNNVVHIDDLAHFIDTLFKTLPPGNRVTTVAAIDPLPVRDVVGMLQEAAGRAGEVRYRREGHSFLISSEHARSLGYRPPTVRDAVERFAASYAAGIGCTRPALSPRR
jgi:nucleoside-diphosphate-sugar epimerase